MEQKKYFFGIIFYFIFTVGFFWLADLAHAQTPVSREYFTFHNLVRNGSFESFDQTQGLPAEWIITDPSKVSLLNDPLQVKVGAVSLNLSGPVKFTQDIRDWKGIEGSNVALGVWMKGNSGDSVKLFVDDGVNRQEKAVSLTDTSWKYVTLKTATAINGSAQSLKVEIEIVSTAAGISLDGVMLSQVSKGVVFVPNPDDQEKSPQDLIYTDGVSGNVGIGTNAPQTALDVLGDIRASGKVYQGESEQQEELLTSSAADEKYLNDDQDETLNGNLTVTGSVKAKGKELIAKEDIQNDFVKKAGDTILGDLIVNGLLTSGTSKILNDLEVTGLVKAARFEGDGSGLTNILSQWKSSFDGTGIYFDQGNVGIGTTNPSDMLEVSGASEPLIRITNTGMAGNPYLIFGMNAGNNAAIFEATTGKDFKFYNGQSALTILGSNGNVGIGNSNPGSKLDVWGPTTGTTAGNKAELARFATFDDNGELLRIFGYRTSNGSSHPTVEQRIQRTVDVSDMGYVGFGSNYLSLSGNSIENMRIDSSGNVGIGTTNPLAQLTLSSGSGILITEGADSNTPYVRLFMSGDQARLASWDNDGGAKNLIINPDGGNVGIGTTSPQNLLDLGTSNGKKLAVYQNPGGSDFYGLGIASETLEFYAGATSTATPSIVLKNTGNVGIGTTTVNNNKLHVVGGSLSVNPAGVEEHHAVGGISIINGGATYPERAIQISSAANGNHSYIIQASKDIGGNNFWYTYGVNTDNTFRINPGADTINNSAFVMNSLGSVGIGTTNPSDKLEVSGASEPLIRITNTGMAGNPYLIFGMNAGNNAAIFEATTGKDFKFYNGQSALTILGSNGNVGIGTTNPSQKLDVAGNIYASGSISGSNVTAHYQDLAEWVRSTQTLEPGTVVSIDPGNINHVIASQKAYDPKIAGVVSRQPGLILGEGGDGRYMIAHSGRVKVKVDASYGAIEIGDMLVASPVKGVAMKSQPTEINGRAFHQPGTILGKALEPLSSGTGEILALLALQ